MDLSALPDPLAPDWGIQLRAWRGAATKEEAARALGVTLSTYDKWERGVRRPSRLGHQQRTPQSSVLERLQALRQTP